MHQPIYEELKRVAATRKTTTYGAIAPLAELDMSNPADRNRIAEILGEISSHEHETGRPLLSAVVVLQETNMPGKGFFTLARELDLLKPGEEELTFFCREVTKVHETWDIPSELNLREQHNRRRR